MIKRIYYFIFKRLPVLTISFLFAIWPFLVIKKVINVGSPKMSVLISGEYLNFFTYYRLIIWGIITLILLVIFLFYIFSIKIKTHFIMSYSLLICLLLWVILSAILSPYIEAFFGMYDRTRGAFAYIVGIIFTFLVSFFVTNNTQRKIIFAGFFICTFFITLFSILQFLGFDPFLNFPLKYLIGVDNQIVSVAPKYTTFAGLYNKNILAGFQSVALVIFSVLFFNAKNKTGKIIFFIMNILIFASLISTSTRGAWAAVVIFLVLYTIFDKKINFLRLFLLIISFIIIFILMDFFSEHTFFKRLSQTFLVSIILLFFIIPVVLLFKKFLPNVSKKKMFASIFIGIIGSLFIFSIFAPFRDNPKIMKLGSIRVYMFWRVSELILKNPVFGVGPETILFNLDVEDTYRYKYLKTQYIDKAHSVYLGLASDSGIPALCFFIALCAIVLQALWKHNSFIGAKVIFWGLVAYFIQALSFDAVICNDLLFYSILGIGIYYTKFAPTSPTQVEQKNTS
ncbi:MAG: O-antigen ligase family protein [Spirochaetes bacterium]|nr:O-antigen ligase family protein [Spirochaetota bacterium]